MNFTAATKTSTEIGYPLHLENGLQSSIPKGTCTFITLNKYVSDFLIFFAYRERRFDGVISALQHIYTDMYLYDEEIRAETELFAAYLNDLLVALRKPLPTNNWELVLEVRDCEEDGTKDW